MNKTAFSAKAAAAVVALALSAGCAPVALTAFGVGTATGVQHTLNGIAYRTFTVPLPQVRSAATTSPASDAAVSNVSASRFSSAACTAALS